MEKPIIIAYYLPQYYQTEYNDRWWGTGFTEWTNVAKAKPLFRKHYQPRIPSEFGFYNLLDSEVREKQANLAKESGITAFCYWHYWLDNKITLLERPFNQVVDSGKPDFQFCLGWANHSWEKKTWSPDYSIIKKEILVEQKYGDKQEIKNHFYYLLKSFKDKRYLKINNKLVFVIFRPDLLNYFHEFSDTWNYLAKKEGLSGFCFIACIVDKQDINKYLNIGYDFVNLSMLNYPFKIKYNKINIIKRIMLTKLLNKKNIVEYKKAIKIFNDKENYNEKVIPTIIPNWDHSPRSGKYGHIINNSNPELFGIHVNNVLNSIKNKKDKIIFIKSWNEWGEGNYLEPDLKYGRKYTNELKKQIEKYCNENK